MLDEGRVFAFGSNSAGHLMLGKPDRHINTPQEILYFKLHKRNCRQVAAGYCHALFVCGSLVECFLFAFLGHS
jgi:alpha-tubulin suppressor-like RCC1 family protein